ncbi:4-amino-4-deoxy-L-arabinose transferase-like glycosyltransferase [Sinomonas atrocyanea]|uniref:ArnT family glycosyltransferase n=1 Tax=Sinomonas atrocyanea TaxID=37927 RepID=UPI002788ECE2|nr:glycosyltransferase family 39 protein [Sinomonas atrocyanea]MDP9882728.1 4-amino-4-deoxy-L-arabinose transferase-like glycosyltransferase [Sinomonas atrocyanea]
MTTSLTPDTGSGSGAGVVDTTPPAAPGGRTAAASSRRRPPARPTWRRVAFGADQPRWVRPSAFGLLVASGFLYLWNLTNSGWANEFYAAAIQAGSKDWTAWFFGSLDAGNAITVDKPPAAFWIPGLLGRIFGFNSFTMLLPEALMGVASVALMYAAVKRVSGPAAGLIAGGALAATPVAALMFRFNNPDAMLTFSLVLAASMTVRAIEKAGWKWLVGAGAVLGLAFLTKMLAGLIVVPALGLAYLWAAPTTLRRRILHLLGALGGLIAVAGAYIAAFTLTPTTVRPYMAGSQTNSFLELTFGYNGLARIFGNRGGGFGGAVRDRASDAGAAAGPDAAGGAGLGGFAGGAPGGGGPGGGNSMFGGSAGLARMFGSSFGTEISWLLPAALILLVAGLWFTRRAARTDRVRASLIVWGGWTVLTAAVFSFMTGTVHSYYAIALAPGIAGVVGLGAAELWRGRAYWPSRIVLAVVVLGTSLWTAVLLGRDASWLPWLRVVTVVLGVLAALGFLMRADRFGAGRVRTGAVALGVTALLAGGLGPAAFTVATASVGHSGAIPTSGPSGAGGSGARAGFAQFRDRLGATRDASPAEAFGGSFGGQPQGGPGGGATASSEVVALLKQATTKWSAITNGSNSASSLELASNTNVIAMGGFTGSDPYPSLDEFKNLVAKGDVTYYIAGGGMGGSFGGRGGGTTDASAITQWVEANFQPQTVGSTTVYKLVK